MEGRAIPYPDSDAGMRIDRDIQVDASLLHV